MQKAHGQKLRSMPPSAKALVYILLGLITGIGRDLYVGVRGYEELLALRALIMPINYLLLWGYEGLADSWVGKAPTRTAWGRFAALLMLMPFSLASTAFGFAIVDKPWGMVFEACAIDSIGVIGIWLLDTFCILERIKTWWRETKESASRS